MKAKFINEAFEKKSKDRAKKELLYPEVANIKDYRSLADAVLYKKVPLAAIPQETIDMLKSNAKTFKELEKLSQAIPVSKEEIDKFIEDSPKRLWEVFIYSDYIDPCTNVELDEKMNIKEVEEKFDEIMDFVFKKENIKLVPGSLLDFNIEFVGWDIDEYGGITNEKERLNLEFFLKRRYGTTSSWQRWIKEQYPDSYERKIYELNWKK